MSRTRRGTEAGRRRHSLRRYGVGAALAAAALSLPSVARAETTTYSMNDTVPIAMTTVNPCNGEPVALTGSYHFTSRYSVTADTTGTKFHSIETKKFSLSGTSPSGARYQNEQQEVVEQNGSFTFESGTLAPYERTDKATMLLIRQGEMTRQDDFYVRFVSHVTYSASGVVNVRPGTLEVVCR